MIQLWPFQERLVGQLRAAIRAGSFSTLLVSPTGSGKTVMFAYLAGSIALHNFRTVILAHRKELLRQIAGTLRQFDVQPGMVAPKEDYRPGPLVHVASVFSVVRRLGKILVPDYVIADEAHHAVAGSTWGRVIDHWRARNPKMQLFGVTATPERMDGTGLGSTFGRMIVGPSVAELIEQGYLSKYKVFAPPEPLDTRQLSLRIGDYARGEVEVAVAKPKIVGDVLAHYRKHLQGRPTIVFAPSVESAHFYAEQYKAAGYQAAAIDGTSKDRDRVTRDFGEGRLNQLVSCDLISEGFDVPGAFGAQLLRPTESLQVYLQQCGRVLRKHPGKEHAIILDHVGNSGRHGLPCDERQWTLEGKKRIGRRDPEDIQIRQCSKCGAVTTRGAARCPECAFEFPVQPRKVQTTEGELEEVKRQRVQRRQEVGMTKTREDLIALAKERNYKNPRWWADKIIQGRKSKRRRTA